MNAELEEKELVEATKKMFPEETERFEKLQESYLPYIDELNAAEQIFCKTCGVEHSKFSHKMGMQLALLKAFDKLSKEISK